MKRYRLRQNKLHGHQDGEWVKATDAEQALRSRLELYESLRRYVNELADEVGRLNAELDDLDSTLHLHQSSGDYEAGRRLGEMAADAVVEKQREKIARFRRDYKLFEEMSPPGVPRRKFVRWCFDAWEKAQAAEGGEGDE